MDNNTPSRPSGAGSSRNFNFIFEELDRRILNSYLEHKIFDRHACDNDFLYLTTICCIYFGSCSSSSSSTVVE